MGEGLTGVPGIEYKEFLEKERLEKMEKEIEKYTQIGEKKGSVTLYNNIKGKMKFRCVATLYQRNGKYNLTKHFFKDGEVVSESIFIKESLQEAIERMMEISARNFEGKIEKQQK